MLKAFQFSPITVRVVVFVQIQLGATALDTIIISLLLQSVGFYFNNHLKHHVRIFRDRLSDLKDFG